MDDELDEDTLAKMQDEMMQEAQDDLEFGKVEPIPIDLLITEKINAKLF